MAGQLIPIPELAAPVPENLTPEQCLALWAEIYEAGEQLLLANLAREVGPGGDVIAAYRRWNEEYLAQHDRHMVEFMENLARREGHRA